MTANIPSTASDAPAKRPFFSLRNLGRLLIAIAIFITLLALFFAEENWRGKRAWENYYRETKARGVILEWEKIIPPEVPEDQNFAMTPFIRPILEFNPEPLQPGQSRWRDTNAYNRIINFGKEFMRAAGNPGISEKEKPVNFEAFLAYLHDPELKKFDSNAPPKMTRKAAAIQFLAEMKPFEPVLDELQAASRRPYTRYNVDYYTPNPGAILLPHLAMLKKFVQIFSYRASAELAAGEPEKALADIRTAYRFQGSPRAEPFIISSMVEIACSEIIVRKPIWEGLATHRWTDGELREIGQILSGISLLKDFKDSTESERTGYGVRLYDYIRSNPKFPKDVLNENGSSMADAFRYVPTGWLYLEQVNHHLFMDRYVASEFEADGVTMNPSAVTSAMHNELTNITLADTLLRHDFIAKMTIPAIGNASQKVAFSQTTLNLAIAACALERNRLAGTALPEKLDALVPRFLDKVPIDVIGGAPIKYRKLDDRHFLLYGIGWNEKDDGGVESINAKGVQDKSQGDWIWPANPEMEN